MFDIKSSHLQNGEYVFSGLYDEEETALLEQLQKDQQNNMSQYFLIAIYIIVSDSHCCSLS